MRKKVEEPKKDRKFPKHLQTTPGMKDALPQDQKYWDFIYRTVNKYGHAYNFKRVETPIVEHPNLFIKGLSKKADVVQDLFAFNTKKANENLCLRAELTLPIARAYLEHYLDHQAHPAKLYATGPVFREANTKYGEARVLHQLGCYIFNEKSSMADVQVIMFAHHILKALGLKISVSINSLGGPDSREKYKEALSSYYKGKKKLLCDSCQKQVAKAPFYVLDCSEECCSEVNCEAPQSVDWLSGPCKDHFIKVLECLDEVDIPYSLNPYLVSGMENYPKTVFKIMEVSEGENVRPVVLGAGGRYEELVPKLIGEEIPIVGYTLIYENVIRRLRQLQIPVEEEHNPEVYIAQLGEMAKKKALSLFESLRADGVSVAESFAKDNLKTQLAIATKMGVKYALVLGQQEIIDGTIIIRDMDGGVQEVLPFDKVAKELKRRLSSKS